MPSRDSSAKARKLKLDIGHELCALHITRRKYGMIYRRVNDWSFHYVSPYMLNLALADLQVSYRANSWDMAAQTIAAIALAVCAYSDGYHRSSKEKGYHV